MLGYFSWVADLFGVPQLQSDELATLRGKQDVSATVDADLLAAADPDAKAIDVSRSELIEQALRYEHRRLALQNYTTHTVPALNVDDYAATMYQANRDVNL